MVLANICSSGGAMSDFIHVPYADAMLLKIPSHLDPVHLASLSDNIPDAYRHLKEIQTNPNQRVLVVGGKAKSVGLYSLLLAKAMNVAEIDYVDDNRERLEIAKQLKANKVYESYSQTGVNYDLVIEASATKSGLETALRAVRNFGTVSSSGIYIKKTPLSLIEMYAKGMTFKTGLANARTDAEHILRLMENVHLPFELITTYLDDWSNAENAFLKESTKVIVRRERMARGV